MANLKNVIYLSNEDYETLVSTGTVTIDGETLTYDENNVYVTPDKLASSTEDGLMSAADKSKLDTLADDSNLVHKTGNETISDRKDFNIIYAYNANSGGTISNADGVFLGGSEIGLAVNNDTYSLYAPDMATWTTNKTIATDEDVVHKTGDETIAGQKTFAGSDYTPVVISFDTGDGSAIRFAAQGYDDITYSLGAINPEIEHSSYQLYLPAENGILVAAETFNSSDIEFNKNLRAFGIFSHGNTWDEDAGEPTNNPVAGLYFDEGVAPVIYNEAREIDLSGWEDRDDSDVTISWPKYNNDHINIAIPNKSGTLAIQGEAITDYEDELPEIDSENKNYVVRLDGDEVYTAEYHASILPGTEVIADTSKKGGSPYTVPNAQLCIDENYVTITAIENGFNYTAFQTLKPFKIGKAKGLGSITFTVNTDRSFKVYVRDFMRSPTSETGIGAKVSVNGTVYTLDQNIDPDTGLPVRVEISFSAGSTTVTLASVEPESASTSDNRRCFLFEGIAIDGSETHTAEWHQLARTEYVDDQISTVNDSIDEINNTLTEQSGVIDSHTNRLDSLDTRVNTIETEMGTVQIFDVDTLPIADKSYLHKLIRYNGRLYQCKTNGNPDAFVKHFSFENVTGSSEVTADNWPDFSRIVTDQFSNYWDAYAASTINVDSDYPDGYHPVNGGTYNFTFDFDHYWQVLSDSNPTAVTINKISYEYDMSHDIPSTPIYDIDYIITDSGRINFNCVYTMNAASGQYDRASAYSYLVSCGLDTSTIDTLLDNVIEGTVSSFTLDARNLKNINQTVGNVCTTLNSYGFPTSVNTYPSLEIGMNNIGDSSDYVASVTSNDISRTSLSVNFTFTNVASDFKLTTGTYTYEDRPWETVKLFREAGSCRLGNSSTLGALKIYRIDDNTLPITRVDIKTKSWSNSKNSILYIEAGNNSTNSNTTCFIQASDDYQVASLQNLNLANDEHTYLHLETLGQDPETGTYADKRIHIYELAIYYGQVSYYWEPVGGSASFEEVNALPETGNEGTIYLMDPESGGGSSRESRNFVYYRKSSAQNNTEGLYFKKAVTPFYLTSGMIIGHKGQKVKSSDFLYSRIRGWSLSVDEQPAGHYSPSNFLDWIFTDSTCRGHFSWSKVKNAADKIKTMGRMAFHFWESPDYPSAIWFTEVSASDLSQFITFDPEAYPDPTFNDYLLAFIGKISEAGDGCFTENLFRGKHGNSIATNSSDHLSWVNTKFTVRFIANYIEADNPNSKAWTGSIADNYLEYQVALVRDNSWYYNDGNNKIRIFVRIIPKRFK